MTKTEYSARARAPQPDYYRNRTLLKTEVTVEDVAEAALFLAGPRSAKTMARCCRWMGE